MVARIAERYVQRLLREADPLEAVGEISGMWGPRATASGTWLGMSRPEHQVTMALIYVGEVGNGGHMQFFSNRGRDIATRVRAALREIGLADLEAILESAFAIFPGGTVPAERGAVDRLFDTLSEDRLAVLDRLDRQAWRLDAYPQLLAYMREHEADLLRPERGLDVSEDAR